MMAMFRSGTGAKGTTKIGYRNENDQIVLGTRGVDGTDHCAKAYAVFCLRCGELYGANGTDLHGRKCPECDGGRPGLDTY